MGRLTLAGVRIAAGGRTLLDGIDLDLRPGELLAIVGSNGAGKSTLLRAIAGLAPHAAGTIALDGRPIDSLAPRDRARAVTMIGADAEAAAGTTVRDVVLTGRFAYRPWWDWFPSEDAARLADDALQRVGLHGFAERNFETLSSGERQRAWLALALAQDARLVLLDEPTSHLDPRHALEVTCVMRGIARETTSVVVVSHDLNEAATIADRIAVLGEGGVLRCAAPNDALDPEILERAYGITFDRLTIDGVARVVARGYRASDRSLPPTGP